ncbi:NAD-dependent epimerase/dehydratase family protein [Micromonospora rubida]
MTTLVTGGTGFVGQHATAILAGQDERVLALDPLSIREELRQAGVEYVRGDVSDLRSLLAILVEHGVDRVIHLGSLLAPASAADPYRALEVNCAGTQNVFEAARILRLANVTWASSMAVFGHSAAALAEGELLTEHTPHSPDNAYGATKSYCEHISRAYRQRYGVNCVGLRIGLVYGAGKERGEGLFTEQLFQRPALGQPGVVPYGDDVYCWQYVRDVAEAFTLVSCLDSADNAVYNLPGTVLTMVGAVETVRALVPSAELTVEPGVLGFPYRIDASPLTALLGDSLRLTSIRDGFAATIEGIAARAGR